MIRRSGNRKSDGVVGQLKTKLVAQYKDLDTKDEF